MKIRRFAIVGLGLTVAGLLLVVGFWPLTSLSGAKLRGPIAGSCNVTNGSQYPGYAQGAQITVHERVISVSFSNFFGNPTTTLELDDGDPNVVTAILVKGDARSVVSEGDVIYATAVLQVIGSFYYWEVATPGNVHQSWPIDAIFYGVMGTGVVVLAIAAFRKS